MRRAPPSRGKRTRATASVHAATRSHLAAPAHPLPPPLPPPLLARPPRPPRRPPPGRHLLPRRHPQPTARITPPRVPRHASLRPRPFSPQRPRPALVVVGQKERASRGRGPLRVGGLARIRPPRRHPRSAGRGVGVGKPRPGRAHPRELAGGGEESDVDESLPAGRSPCRDRPRHRRPAARPPQAHQLGRAAVPGHPSRRPRRANRSAKPQPQHQPLAWIPAGRRCFTKIFITIDPPPYRYVKLSVDRRDEWSFYLCYDWSEPRTLRGLPVLNDPRLYNTGLQNVDALRGLRALRRLDLWGCTGLEDVDALRDLFALRNLNLAGCTGLRSVDGLRGLHALRELDISGCTGLGDVDGLRGLRALERLHMSGCTGLRNVDGIRDLPSLFTLSLQGSTGLPASALRELRAALPQTLITFPDGGSNPPPE